MRVQRLMKRKKKRKSLRLAGDRLAAFRKRENHPCASGSRAG